MDANLSLNVALGIIELLRALRKNPVPERGHVENGEK
jgi:hypothetical protein